MKTAPFTEPPDEFTSQEKIKYAVLGLVVIGGSFFIGRTLIRNARATSEEKKTFEEGNPATYAKQIKMSFDNDMWWGWGTDEQALRRVVMTIPSKEEFKKVINSYQKLYARSMMADMQEELSSSEYNEMLAIVAAKPDRGNAPITIASSPAQFESWAKRLKAAFDKTYGIFPGTDEAAIGTIFKEMPTQAAFWQTAEVYKEVFGQDLVSALKSELELFEYPVYMNIILKKPKE